MFAIGIDLLTGSYIATAYNDRDRVEWPPHPARLFSALVATWASMVEEPAEPPAALRWLEALGPPHILASGTDATGFRSVAPVFVPVNDASIISAPNEEKLDAALAVAAQASDEKSRTKAQKDVVKLQKKLLDDTARAIAAPAKIGKGDAARALALFPEKRVRQPRTFPAAIPEVPRVAFVWPDAHPDDSMRAELEGLLASMVRLGHSSTLVACRLLGAEDVPSWEDGATRFRPDPDDGDVLIRWVDSGQLERLARAFVLHRETEPRVLPASFARYREGDAPTQRPLLHSVFASDFVVLARVGGPRLPILSVAGLSRQIRRALMAHAAQPVSEMLSGHQVDRSASERAHLAIVPLPFVGSEHADGAILGVGLMLPGDCTQAERASVLEAVEKLESNRGEADERSMQVLLGEAGILELQRVQWGEHRLQALRTRRWVGASRFWATATPIALDRMPGDLHAPDASRRAKAFEEASASVVTALQRIVPGLLAEHVEVDVLRSCVLPGTAKPRNYPRFPIDSSRPQRVLVHARITFAAPVEGPLVVGAGRYQGLGLLMPIRESQTSTPEPRS